jgi:hypothetical protein
MSAIKNILRFLFLIFPVINVLADVTIGYFGEHASFHSGHIRAIVILSVMVLVLPGLNFKIRPTLVISLFLLYSFILLFGSSNFSYSFLEYLKFFISLMMYPMAFKYIKTKEDLGFLHISYLVACVIAVLQFVFAQLFKVGDRAYEVGIYLGGSEVQITYILAYIGIIFPSILIINPKLKTWILNSIILSNLAFVVITFRRSSIVATVIGFLVLFFLGSNRRILARFFILVSIGLVIVGFVYQEEITLLLDSRLRVENEMQRDNNRFGEFDNVKKPFVDGNLKEILFGKEVFNSINLEIFRNTETKIRPLHVDYNNILFGMGIVGLSFYFLVFYQIVKTFLIVIVGIKDEKMKNEIKAVFFAVLLSNFVFSTSGQIWDLTSLSFVFVYLGSLTSISFHSPETLVIEEK